MTFAKVFNKPFGKTFDDVFAGHFAPTDIATLVLWLDASFGVITGAPGVERWEDQSGFNNLAFQPTSDERPGFNGSGLNGFPTLTFNGSDETLIINSTDSINLNSDFTFYTVINTPDTANIRNFCAKNGDNSYRFRLMGNEALETVCNDGGGLEADASSGTIAVNTDIIAEIHYQVGGTINFTSNGVSLGSATNTLTSIAQSVANLFIGSTLGNAEYYQGDMAQLLLFNELLSTSDRNRVGEYLATRYGLTWTLVV